MEITWTKHEGDLKFTGRNFKNFDALVIVVLHLSNGCLQATNRLEMFRFEGLLERNSLDLT